MIMVRFLQDSGAEVVFQTDDRRVLDLVRTPKGNA
jgi:hypothetical protein